MLLYQYQQKRQKTVNYYWSVPILDFQIFLIRPTYFLPVMA